MIYSIRIDGIQRPPVTLKELGAMIERGEFKPGDSLIGPGVPQWSTGIEASAHLHRQFPGRLPAGFGAFVPPPRRPDPPAAPERSGCMVLAKVLLVLFAIGALLGLALLLLLIGLCGGFR